MEHFDAIIIGTGQAGSPLSSFLSKKNLKIAVVEASFVGGTCVNRGCTPTKTLVGTARVAHLNRNSDQFGITHSPLAFDYGLIQKRKNDVVSESRNGSEKRLKTDPNIRFLEGKASFSGPKEVLVRFNDSGIADAAITAPYIFINTGTRPKKASFPGIDTVKCLNSDELLELDTIPEDLIVIGGSYMAAEFGQLFSRLGSRVTILAKTEALMSREDEDVSTELEQILRKEGITIHLGVKVSMLSPLAGKDGVQVSFKTKEGTEKEVKGSHLFAALGRSPNTEELNLAAAGIQLNEEGYIEVDEYLETNVKGVYALGDVKGGPAFTHISYDDYRIVSHNLFEAEKKTIAGRVVPYCVFTDPELGRTGLTEKEARKKMIAYRLAKLPMSSVARAIEAGETAGFIKVLVAKDSDLILGAAVLGVNGGELSAFLHLAILGKIPFTVIRDNPFAHPTLIESFNNLFFKFQEEKPE